MQRLSRPFEPISLRKGILKNTVQSFDSFGTANTEDVMMDWMWKGPEDREIDKLVPLKNEYEINEGIEMSKQGIVNFVDQMIKKESPHASSQWQSRMSTDGLKMSTREGGSKYN